MQHKADEAQSRGAAGKNIPLSSPMKPRSFQLIEQINRILEQTLLHPQWHTGKKTKKNKLSLLAELLLKGIFKDSQSIVGSISEQKDVNSVGKASQICCRKTFGLFKLMTLHIPQSAPHQCFVLACWG